MKMIKKTVKTTLVIALLGGSSVFAQTLADAKKALDAEQYQKANSTLKSLITSQPLVAENYFYLGNLYLTRDYPDSAKTTFNAGIAKDPKFALNYVGLGSLDLQTNNMSAAKANFDKAIVAAGKKNNDAHIFAAKALIAAPKPDYTTAVTYLQKAIAMDVKDAEAYLALGDAYRGLDKNSEAFSAYRSASDLNKGLLRSQVELGVITKRASAWQESVDAFNNVIKTNPNYGPAYRELAETYLRWANKATESKDYESKIKLGLDNYAKYMSLTDQSLESRMRYADFLILAKDYKTLQKEGEEMAKLDKTNPRIYRYLGYAAYETGNYPSSIESINQWMSKAEKNRLHPFDFLYLGKAQLKTGATAEGIKNLTKAVTDTSLVINTDPAIAAQIKTGITEQMSTLAKGLFDEKKYSDAAQVYELSLNAPKPSVQDRFYVGFSQYFHYTRNVPDADKSRHRASLVRADSAFNNVNKAVPTFALAYYYKGKVNQLLDDEKNPKGLAIPSFEKFVEIQGAVQADKYTPAIKSQMIDATYYLGYNSIKSNPSKAKEYFNKVLQLDPTNVPAQTSLKSLASN
jgi:tetratricopeptide (TPR) repeat protein